MEIHTIESFRDEEKFRVLVTKAPSGARFQWAVHHSVLAVEGMEVSTDDLNWLLYHLVENG